MDLFVVVAIWFTNTKPALSSVSSCGMYERF
jgi:hypothetical protein